MMRSVVGGITGVIMALYTIYFVSPLITTTHSNFSILVNSSDTTIATSYTLGQGVYSILPLLPLIGMAFVLINIALKRDAGD